ncbi:nicotinamide N-methyltransferase [Acaromyces ingoldii]|uniref:Nicotinamide N-methyltransferase n=1 Tax=Acaromyces ingoldii TaxID=215250 RepID=A0A316YDK7_9BASI|nr:nicotinamide N-methyltransferase [Acaromyces ingoldii]PWN87586.1 nicotinamide N-methyltransferase [Acaromyces ingoldii]
MAHSETSDDDGGLDLFDEPEGFRPKTPPPTTASYTLRLCGDGEGQQAEEHEIQLDLVGSHPLWGHHLWNAAPTLSDFLAGSDRGHHWCKGARVLELGAAAGLPSIVAAKLGAKRVIATDYPDPGLITNLSTNLARGSTEGSAGCASAQGYIWGHDAAPLLSELEGEKFDLLILSDLIFNHQAHPALLQTMDACLAPPRPCALVFFSHHRPHLADRDMDFFTQAGNAGWLCEEVGQWKMPPMFPKDAGSEEVRGTVHGWRVWR